MDADSLYKKINFKRKRKCLLLVFPENKKPNQVMYNFSLTKAYRKPLEKQKKIIDLKL